MAHAVMTATRTSNARITDSKAAKLLISTMNGVNVLAALAGIMLSKTGFEFFQKLELPQGLDVGKLVGWEAFALGMFGLGVGLLALAGAYFLNKGTKNSKITYFLLVVIAAFVVLYLKSRLPKLEETVHAKMSRAYQLYYAKDRSKQIVDSFQVRFRCCGYNGVEDFPEWRWLPDGCCPLKSVKKEGRCLRKFAYAEPCKSQIAGQMGAYFYSLDTVSFIAGSALIALIAIVAFFFVTDKSLSLSVPQKQL